MGLATWMMLRKGYRRAYEDCRAELTHALAVIDFDLDRLHVFEVPDQEATNRLPELIDRVRALLVGSRATLIATHAYEGGHPDHDAAAFVVAEAVARLDRPPPVVEAPFYHDALGHTVYGRFIARDGCPVDEHRLAPDELARKQAMLAAYPSQREVLDRFDITVERLRPAPRYDFTAPPHAGRLHYERWGWPLDGATFRARVAEARARHMGVA